MQTTEKRTLAHRNGGQFGVDDIGTETDDIISEVDCAGPKHYAYKGVNTSRGAIKTVCKVGGITLYFSASKSVNFEKMTDMILTAYQNATVIVRTPNKMKREMCRGCVHILSEPEE
jgi:hypothetical protein